MEISSQRLDFWNSRSSLGLAAGSGDTNLKKLEIDALRNCIKGASTILDAGCGNAYTLLQLSSKSEAVYMYGFDYSEGMIKSGKNLLNENNMTRNIKICQGNLLSPPEEKLRELGSPAIGFDIIYTERSLINLNSLEEQSLAVSKLWDMLSPGGKLILCEAFTDGLKEINYFRGFIDLPEIKSPWHNRYLSLAEIYELPIAKYADPVVIEFSSTYYFVSRVINARVAALEGKEPSYDALINLESMHLPPLNVCGQSKIVIFQKS